LAVIAGLSCGLLAQARDQGAKEAQAQRTTPPKGANAVTDPATMAGEKPSSTKPVIVGGAPVEKSYVIGAEDILQIFVIEQTGISGQYTVRPDGIISVPLVGEVQAGGLTTTQLETAIGDKLKANEIIKDPSVTVGLVASHSRKYYISGEVNKPGQFDLVVPTHVSAALANAGGFKDFAKKNKIRIVRKGPNGKPEVYYYNDKEVSHGKKPEQDILLEPGDHIYVD